MKTRALLFALVMAPTLAAPAWAALGGDAASVQADLLRMKGELRSRSSGAVTVHEITADHGMVVRQYLTPGGKVFAVSWRGPVNPDLRQLFGTYYGQFEQAAATTPHSDLRHLAIEQPGLVVRISGRLRAFSGRAWLPEMVPNGFSVADIE